MEETLQVVNFIIKSMNGLTEFVLLMLGVYLDTILGSKWRIKNDVSRASKDALKGIALQSGLALFVLLVYLMKILIQHFTHEDLFLFDWISAFSFYFIAKWMLVSIIANAKLAGFDIPDWVGNVVDDEITAKKKRGGLDE